MSHFASGFWHFVQFAHFIQTYSLSFSLLLTGLMSVFLWINVDPCCHICGTSSLLLASLAFFYFSILSLSTLALDCEHKTKKNKKKKRKKLTPKEKRFVVKGIYFKPILTFSSQFLLFLFFSFYCFCFPSCFVILQFQGRFKLFDWLMAEIFNVISPVYMEGFFFTNSMNFSFRKVIIFQQRIMISDLFNTKF